MALSYSRFRNTSLVKTQNGAETYGLMEGFDVLKNLTGDQYQNWITENKYEGRPDLIALFFYNLSYYDWVIIMANRPKNPLNWPKTGDVIKIPNLSLIRTLF
jgi:small nuclear ribonucleoprotein (snRNP)-like protein